MNLADLPVAPMTERDDCMLDVAEWLSKEGHTAAAAALVALVERRPIIELMQIKGQPQLRDELAVRRCRIYSREHMLYWRANANGYTSTALEAGVYAFADAYRRTSHCGPEKGVAFEILPETPEPPPRESGWKS